MQFEFKVSGITFRDLEGFHPTAGEKVILLPAPMTDYPNAIKVFVDGVHVGYVPNNQKLDLAIEMKPIMEKFQSGTVIEFQHKDDDGWNTEGRGKLHYMKVSAQFDIDDKNFTHYEKDDIQFERISTIVSSFTPGGFDYFVKWAYGEASTYAEYKQLMLKYQIDGTNTHLLMEKYFRGILDPSFKDAGGIEALPTGAQNWLAKHDVEPISLEETLYDYENRIAGTFDFYGIVDSVKELIDWKSSKAIRQSHRLQDAFYTTIHPEAEQGRVIAFGAENKQKYSESIIQGEKLKRFYEVVVNTAKAYHAYKG